MQAKRLNLPIVPRKKKRSSSNTVVEISEVDSSNSILNSDKSLTKIEMKKLALRDLKRQTNRFEKLNIIAEFADETSCNDDCGYFISPVIKIDLKKFRMAERRDIVRQYRRQGIEIEYDSKDDSIDEEGEKPIFSYAEAKAKTIRASHPHQIGDSPKYVSESKSEDNSQREFHNSKTDKTFDLDIDINMVNMAPIVGHDVFSPSTYHKPDSKPGTSTAETRKEEEDQQEMVTKMQKRLKNLRDKKIDLKRLETIQSITNSSEYSNYDLAERFEKVYKIMR